MRERKNDRANVHHGNIRCSSRRAGQACRRQGCNRPSEDRLIKMPSRTVHEQPELLTIAEAAERLHSKVTVSALHAARAQGRLWAVKIGKLYFTTWPAVVEFLQCPATANLHASTSVETNGNTSYATAAPSYGQDMALASVQRLKQRSRNISQAENRQTAEVRHIRGN